MSTSSTPQIELKKFQWYPRLSEETNAFNADVVVDGVTCISVSNAGHGGGNEYWATGLDAKRQAQFKEGMAKLQAHVKTLPPLKTEYGELTYNLDLLIDELVGKQIEAKEANRLRSKYAKEWEHTLFFIDGEGQILTSKIAVKRSSLTPRHFEAVKAKNPKLTLIEAGSFDEAWPTIHAALFPKAKEDELASSNGGEEVAGASKRKGR